MSDVCFAVGIITVIGGVVYYRYEDYKYRKLTQDRAIAELTNRANITIALLQNGEKPEDIKEKIDKLAPLGEAVYAPYKEAHEREVRGNYKRKVIRNAEKNKDLNSKFSERELADILSDIL